jgi:hypothetical protein
MICSEFISGFSDYFDGVGEPGFLDEAEAHLVSCCSCRRYREIIERGSALIRSEPPLTVSGDFYPRLQHRLFHVDDHEALSRTSSASAATGATILGMALLLTAVAWSPIMRPGDPEVELSPIVVHGPNSSRALGLRTRPVSFSSSFADMRPRFSSAPRGFWDGPDGTLWQSLPVFERYGPTGGLRRVRLD